jgi:hypothetical protein
MHCGWKALAISALLLLGYEGAQPPPIDVRAIGKVQAELKRQVAIYMHAAQDAPIIVKIDGVDTDIRNRKDLFWCGSGNVDFDISEVKAELTTSIDTSVGFDFHVSPPAPIPASGSFSFSRGTRNSQILDYNLWPLGMDLQSDEFQSSRLSNLDNINSAPIARVLLSLRQAQVTGARESTM